VPEGRAPCLFGDITLQELEKRAVTLDMPELVQVAKRFELTLH
jgi:hypothetical protein